ncbi:MAG: GNAT family N-acetyltransferase, partial [Bryocella sp.]
MDSVVVGRGGAFVDVGAGCSLAWGMAEDVRIERVGSASAEAMEIVREYYEAVSVVVRDSPAALEALIGDPDSGMWLAWVGDAVVGCVVLRRLSGIADAGECKRLYVRPAARGKKV